MHRKAGCEYQKLCSTADFEKNFNLSYWPRVSGLMPYCAGLNEPSKCVIHSHLDLNPDQRNGIRKVATENTLFNIAGRACVVIGPFLLIASEGVQGKAIGAGCLLTGIYSIANSIVKKYGRKNILSLISDYSKTDGIDDVYERIIQQCSEADADMDTFWGSEMEEENTIFSAVSDVYQIANLAFSIKNVTSLQSDETRFKIGKVQASYFLTDKFDVLQEKDVGIVLSCPYEHKYASDPRYDRSDAPETTYFGTGMFFPKISRHKLKDGSGFMQRYREKPLRREINENVQMGDHNVNLAADVNIDADGSVSIAGSFDPNPDLRIMLSKGDLEQVFSDNTKFDSIANGLTEGSWKDAKRLHTLMQDAYKARY